jgi:hypothetical protein
MGECTRQYAAMRTLSPPLTERARPASVYPGRRYGALGRADFAVLQYGNTLIFDFSTTRAAVWTSGPTWGAIVSQDTIRRARPRPMCGFHTQLGRVRGHQQYLLRGIKSGSRRQA